MIAEKYLAQHSLGAQQSLGEGELDNAYWAPGAENPAEALTIVQSDMAPLPGLSEAGHCNRGLLRPLKGLAWTERAGHGKREN